MIYDSIDVIGIDHLLFSSCRCLFFEVFVSFDEQQQLMNFEEQKKGLLSFGKVVGKYSPFLFLVPHSDSRKGKEGSGGTR